MNGWKTVHIKNDTMKLLPLAVQEYLRHHPEMKGARISNNHIIRQALEFYIKTPAFRL